MAFMNDGQFLVASDSDGILTFWNVRTRQQTVVNTRGAVNVISAVGENLVLVGYSDGILRVFDSSGELKKELPGEVGEIHSITMMQDGSLVLFGDLGIRKTNPNGIESYMRSLGCQYQKNERSNYYKTAANANCGLAVHTNSSGNITLRSLSTGDSIALLVGQISPIISLALSDDGYAVAGTQNGSLCVWNLKMLVADNLLEKRDPKRHLMAQRDCSSNARSYDRDRPQNWEAGFQWYSGKKMHEGSHEIDQDSQDDGFSVERINFNPTFDCITVTKSGGQVESFDVDGRQILPDFSNSGSLQYESLYRQEGGLPPPPLKSGLTVSWESDSLGGGFININHAILNGCLHRHFYPAERLYFVSLSDNGQNFAVADHEGYFSILNSQSGEILFRLFLRNLSSVAFFWGNSMIAVGYGTGKSEIIYLSGL
jgi:WD40 repeat protein